MPPNIAAIYTTVQHSQNPAATSARTVLNRIGGSLGTALLVVVLQHALARGEAPAADAYAHTFWWALAIGACALIPAALYPWH
ncbi:hypothetical protein ABZ412_35305 [Nocardia sp. NPDC005746]|uniref:hypothetical protein n=1 Tax=Nocardia sp. NPDC005746 TaxID=3157062 RepID=UPI0033C5AF98